MAAGGDMVVGGLINTITFETWSYSNTSFIKQTRTQQDKGLCQTNFLSHKNTHNFQNYLQDIFKASTKYTVLYVLSLNLRFRQK